VVGGFHCAARYPEGATAVTDDDVYDLVLCVASTTSIEEIDGRLHYIIEIEYDGLGHGQAVSETREPQE
jgi:hypothetical protein